METQTCSSGNRDNGGLVGLTMDDGDDAINELGDRIAGLTLAQVVQLVLYLKIKHGLSFNRIIIG